MSKVLPFILMLALAYCGVVLGATADHSFNNPNTTATVDDEGRFTGRFRIIMNSVDQFGEGGLMVRDGGVFDMAEPMPTKETDGTLAVEFSGCNEGMMSYDIPSLSLVGDIPIQRIALDNADECQAMQGNVTAQ